MFRRLILCFSLISILGIDAYATHIRAGEITAVRISQSGLRYRFTLTIYRDTEGVPFGDGGVFNFGQGRTIGPGIEALRADQLLEYEKKSAKKFTKEANYKNIVSVKEINKKISKLNMSMRFCF